MNKIILILFFAFVAHVSFAQDNVKVKPKTTKKKTDSSKVQTTPVNKSAGTQQTPPDTSKKNTLSIDTTNIIKQEVIPPPIDTAKKVDSLITEPVSENVLTNTKLFIYILMSAGGLGLFFYIFVLSLFKTFHRKRSTRQSLLLAWNLFFVVSIIWLFIVWGLVAGFWTSSAFMVVMIFLFLVSLIMTIIAVKTK